MKSLETMDLQSIVFDHLTTSSFFYYFTLEVTGLEPMIVISKTNVFPLDYTSFKGSVINTLNKINQ
jgi:hypothetical protein